MSWLCLLILRMLGRGQTQHASILMYVVYTLSQLSEWGEFWGFQIPAFQYQTERIPNGKNNKKSVNHFLPLYLTS